MLKPYALILALALALALTGCAAHTTPIKSPGSSEVIATNIWLRLAESDQTTAQNIAKRLEPGQIGYFNDTSGQPILLTRPAIAPNTVAIMIPRRDLEGHYHVIQADVERGDDQAWFARAKVLGTTAEERECLRIMFTHVHAELLDMPAGTPVLE